MVLMKCRVKSQYCVIYYKEYCKIFQVLGDKIIERINVRRLTSGKTEKINAELMPRKNTLTKREKQEDFI